MAVFRIEKTRDYTVMSNHHLRDKSLSLKAKGILSLMLSLFREVVFGVGFALLLPVFFGLNGVLYSMPVSDILTFLISAFIIRNTYQKLNAEGGGIA